MNPPYKNTAYPIKYVGNTPLNIVRDKRINIDYAEEYRDKEWRFYIEGNKFVSVFKK